MARRATAVLFLLVGCATSGWAQGGAYLVKDIRSEPGFENEISGWDELIELDGAWYFGANDGVHGWELWRWTEAEGAAMVVDLCPGVCSSRPFQLTRFGKEIFLVADDGNHGWEPWMFDGAAGGLRPLRETMDDPGAGLPFFPTVVGERLYFSAGGASTGGRELWATDGTIAGTEVVLDIEPGPVGSNPVSLTEFEGLLYFTAETSAEGRELWRSDGTAGGTELVLDYCPGDCDAFWPEQWTPFGDSRVLQEFAGELLVLAGPGGPSTLTVLQQEPAALLVLSPEVNRVWTHFFSIGGRFFFNGCDPPFDCELWWSDGTPAGTERVKDIRVGSTGSDPVPLGVVGSEFFFFANDGVVGAELWKSDGTEAGTVLVADIANGAASSANLARFPGRVVGGYLVVRADDGVHGSEYWSTDGTAAGTVLLADLWPGPPGSEGEFFAPVGQGEGAVIDGRLVLAAANASEGIARWSTDGTPAGTELFLDLNQQASAFPPTIFGAPSVRSGAYSGALLFGADDGSTGLELWSSDGTEEGTHLVADLDPGLDARGLPLGSQPLDFLDLQGAALVGASAGVWATDGSEAGTTQLNDQRLRSPFVVAPPAAAPVEAFFSADTISTPSHLYATDGTAAGTGVVVTDVAGTPELLGDLLLFPRDTAGEGTELWGYPTAGGPAYLVGDLDPGVESSWPSLLGTFGSLMLFSAGEPAQGRELWASDGEPDGTFVVRDIQPGPGSSEPSAPHFGAPPPRTTTGLFFVADDGTTGAELWRTDGSEEGTVQVVDLRPGASSSAPSSAVAVGQTVAFLGDDGIHGRELWTTTGSGATLVRDIRPGAESSSAVHTQRLGLVAVGPVVYFAATDGVHGVELWASDLTTEGTVMLQDINPGSGSSSPGNFVQVGDRLYFSASDGVHGFELWALPLDLSIFADGFESGDLTAWSAVVP